MDAAPQPDSVYRDRVRIFQTFLANSYNYAEAIVNMLQREETRLIVNLDHLRGHNRELATAILTSPIDALPACNDGLHEAALVLNPQGRYNIADTVYSVGFSGSFGDHHVSPRTVKASHLSKMVSMEAIVTRCSLVRPKMVKSIHFCPATNAFHSREYRDATTAGHLPPTTSITPREDDAGNPLQMEYGLSTFRDHQRISIQEMPERSPAGQLPRSIDVILDDDLVDVCKPGDRIQLVGVYRSLGGGGSGGFKTVIMANNIILLSSKVGGGVADVALSEHDIRQINLLSQRTDIVRLLSQSLAASIYGHEEIKMAVLLLLLGGAEKNLANGTHIRGDINMLMVGDPSTAKSQMLRFVLSTAPLAIATTGRGSSGVGLTAAVTTDKDTGERRLEAGAMVLADRGVVCIDEFDKMSDIDRVAIHEVMEQQTVTIAKAGIHTSLNARCSVIAAANPVYGQYDVHKDPHKNIALPDSLLSRFDLLFVVTDDADEKRDRMISTHVLRLHRYLPPGIEEGTPAQDNLTQQLFIGNPNEDSTTVPSQTSPFEKFDPLLHGGVTTSRGRTSKKKEVLSVEFIKKYIYYAKQRPAPRLTKGAADHIVNAYATFRNEEEEGKKRTTPLTARTLETLIRLSTAHAKARLSSNITQRDARAAEEILRFALFKEVAKRQRRKRRKLNRGATGARRGGDDDDSEDGSDDDEDDDDELDINDNAAPTTTRRAKDASYVDESQDTVVDDAAIVAEALADTSMTDTGIPPHRLKLFRDRFGNVNATRLNGEPTVNLNNLVEMINEGLSAQHLFSTAEATRAMEEMSEDVTIDGDVVFIS